MNTAKLRPATTELESATRVSGVNGFHDWLQAQAAPALADYDRRLHESLSSQDPHRMTQRSLVGATEALFERALRRLRDLGVDGDALATTESRLRGFLAGLLGDALSHNRRSCALTNFPEEHRPDNAYVQDMARDLEAICQALLNAAGGHGEPQLEAP